MLKITVTKEEGAEEYRATAIDVANLMKADPGDPDSPMVPTPMGSWNLRRGSRAEAVFAAYAQHGQHYDIHPEDVTYEGCEEPTRGGATTQDTGGGTKPTIPK
ncbi:hypothetical protein [Rhizobacter sp. SG703]|uniref:hypothetical protein n=1 Tax=Rhizobacter sp. SG703 TaxID=2587140 RepID=UPI0014489563|nr:hypothetical protein [Rhizobacter sp. SG703]NKI94792.1 hypothetical protein [Rhizobacter sp. SG703]